MVVERMLVGVRVDGGRGRIKEVDVGKLARVMSTSPDV